MQGFSYTYDSRGQRTQALSLAGGADELFRYDSVGRLERWERGASRFEEYTYDQVGNRLSLTDEAGTVTYDYDAAHRLIGEDRSFLNGDANQVTIYSWDGNGQLTQKTGSGGSSMFEWDALGRLKAITEDGGTTRFGYRPDGIRSLDAYSDDSDHPFQGTRTPPILEALPTDGRAT